MFRSIECTLLLLGALSAKFCNLFTSTRAICIQLIPILLSYILWVADVIVAKSCITGLETRD